MSPTDCLGVSWPVLTGRMQARATLTRWGVGEPVLDGIATFDDLAAIVHFGGDPVRADEVIGALVRFAAVDGGDEKDAALLVAHLLANGSRRLALQLRDLSSDIDDLLAGELWLQIRTFPWRRRTRAFAKSLLLDTRSAVLAELRPYRTRQGFDPVVLVDPTDTAAGGGQGDADLLDGSFTNSYDRDECRLLDVLEWAQRCGVVDQSDVQLLIDLVAAAERIARAEAGAGRHRGLNTAAEIAEVAGRRGVHVRTIRRHRDRALAALRQPSGNYLAAVA
jgi:hypothetical protein